MKTLEHITEETIRRYNERESDAMETLRVQTHIADCAACRDRLAQSVGVSESFAALQNEFDQTDFEHLPYEQLAAYVDEKLDSVDREIADSHFVVCRECTDDLIDLRRYREIAEQEEIVAATLPERKIAEEPKAAWWKKLFAFDSFFGSAFVPAGAFAVLLVGVLIAAIWFVGSNRSEIARIENTNQTNQNLILPAPTAVVTPSVAPTNEANVNAVQNSNQPAAPQNAAPANENQSAASDEPRPLLALNDAGGQITVGSDGSLSGLPTESAAVREKVERAVKNQRLALPASINQVTSGNIGVLMSGSEATNNGVPFALVSPVGRSVRANQPTLRWKPLAGATKYTVAVVDQKFRVVAESPALTKPEWTLDRPLARGAIYSWQVTATKETGEEIASPTSPAPQAKFYVVAQSAFDEVKRIEASGTKSHLVRGIIYANAGLIEEARREFQMLVKQNPNSALARKLLASVR